MTRNSIISLVFKVRKPAEAEKARLETLAVANRERTLLEGAGAAEATALRGDAEAFAVHSKAKAKAEEMSAKAEAFKEYQKAAKISMWLDSLPAMAAEVAAPISQVGKVTMVGFPDGKEGLGPARLTGEVLGIVEQIPLAVEQMTGHKVATVK